MAKFVSESEEQVKLRKYRGELMVCGGGMFLFSVWGVLKETMIFFAGRQSGWELAKAVRRAGLSRGAFLITLYSILAVYLIVCVLLGSKALRIGRGKTQTKGYAVFTVICAVWAILTIAVMAVSNEIITSFLSDPFDTVITFGVDVTSAVNTAAVMVYSAKIRKLEKSGVK